MHIIMVRPGYEAESVATNFIPDKNSCQHTKDYELTTIRTNDSGLAVRTLFPEYYGSSSASQWSD